MTDTPNTQEQEWEKRLDEEFYDLFFTGIPVLAGSIRYKMRTFIHKVQQDTRIEERDYVIAKVEEWMDVQGIHKRYNHWDDFISTLRGEKEE